jgi:enoyl-CoA hydratase/carnithine racemase
MSEFVTLARQGAFATIALDRASARNALTWEMWRAITKAVAAAEADDAVKVLLLKGAGDCFAAGADIDEMGRLAQDPEQAKAFAADMLGAMQRLARFTKPSIAIIKGACVGGGMTLALACDFRFAGLSAKLGITPARLGLVSPLADSARLADIVGLPKAKDLLFTARLVDAEEAKAIGLVDQLAGDDAIEGAAYAYAERMAELSQTSLKGAKRMLGRALDGQKRDDAETLAEFVEALTGPDFREGRDAFLSKRRPNFSA